MNTTSRDIIDEDNDSIFFTHHLDSQPLVGEQSADLRNISGWFNPIDEFTRLKNLNSSIGKPIDDSTYEYHVLIQIGGDDTAAKSTARLLAKYPNNSLVIQFDISSEQWKVLHGDLHSKIKGKIRWTAIGHGQYIGLNNQSLFERYQAYQFVSGINYLKRHVLTSYPPNKIVLAGCQLGRGGVNESFAFRTSVELAKHGVYLPVVSYNRPISVTNESKKITWPYDLTGEKQSTKNWRLEISINPISQQGYINGKHASLYFIDELRSGELEVWQLIKDLHSASMDIFRDPNNEYKIDVDLIKKIAFNHDAYIIFKQKISNEQDNFNSDFRQELIHRYESIGIIETPLWQMVDIASMNAKEQKPNDTIKIIIRSGNGLVGKKYAEDLIINDPDSTLLFQLNPNTMEMFVEYGDTERLLKTPKQQWILIDNIYSGPSFIQNYANSLNVLKERYNLQDPENISLYLTDTKALLNKDAKVSFIEQLSIRLKENRIYSKFFLEPHFEAKDKLKSLLEDISLGKVLVDNVDIIKHPYLKRHFTLQDGGIDKKS